MGSGRDKRKKLNPTPPGTGQAKTEKKSAAAEAKQARRAERGDEDDLDALLARARLDDAAATEVTIEQDVAPPSARANVSLTLLPALPPGRPASELLLFGGECTDDAGKVRVFSELFRFETAKRRWSLIRSPGSPPPRSAHQAVLHRHFVYVFGGEFTSPNQAQSFGSHCSGQASESVLPRLLQERFHHYKDLWRLDVTTWKWEQLSLRGAPSARRACVIR
jgi:hypothetical protein